MGIELRGGGSGHAAPDARAAPQPPAPPAYAAHPVAARASAAAAAAPPRRPPRAAQRAQTPGDARAKPDGGRSDGAGPGAVSVVQGEAARGDIDEDGTARAPAEAATHRSTDEGADAHGDAGGITNDADEPSGAACASVPEASADTAGTDAPLEAGLLDLSEREGIFELLLAGGQSVGVVVSHGPGSLRFLLSTADAALDQRLKQNKMELERRLQRRIHKDVQVAVL